MNYSDSNNRYLGDEKTVSHLQKQSALKEKSPKTFALIGLIFGLNLLMTVNVVSAQTKSIPALSPLPELRLNLGDQDAVIVSPQSPDYMEIASNLAKKLGVLTGKTPEILSDFVNPSDIGEGPILVLGNMMDSRIARKLYLEAYDFTDCAWPGVNGYMLRTIRDPFGTGANVLMIGGSNVDGVRGAADALTTHVGSEGPELRYMNKVKLGRFANEIKSYTAKILEDDNKVWHRSGISGSWDFQISIAMAAIGYLRTANEQYLQLYKRELRYWFDHDVFNPSDEAPQMLHGFLNQLIITWDLVRDHQSFSDTEREKFDEDFLWVFSSREGPTRIETASEKKTIRGNHGTRAALDALFGGRYFLKRFGLKRGKHWIDIAESYFSMQIISAKPGEDSWGHQWNATLYNTLVYAMAVGKDDYFTSVTFTSAAERALIAHPNGGGPRGYLSACSVAANDSGFLSGFESGDSLIIHSAKMDGLGDEYLRSFCTGKSINCRTDLSGVSVAKMDSLWYETIDLIGFNPDGIYKVTQSREKCFDKASIRDGWNQDSYYLLFDGVSGGNHSFHDVNCIVQYHEGGASWLTHGYTFRTTGTVSYQNGVVVSYDGAGPGSLHRYSRLLYSGESGDYFALAGALKGVGTADWERHIIRKNGAWTLVVDRITVADAGETLAERHWHIQGEVTALDDGVTSFQEVNGTKRVLHLQSAGLENEGMTGTSHRIEKVRFKAKPNDPLEYATLLYVNGDIDELEFKLSRASTGWRIDAANGTEIVIVDKKGENGVSVMTPKHTELIGKGVIFPSFTYVETLKDDSPPYAGRLPIHPECKEIFIPWRMMYSGSDSITAVAVSENGLTAGGDSSGNVYIFGEDGNKLASAKLDAPVVSLHFVGMDLITGDDRGGISRFSPDGTEQWRMVIPYVPISWPYWSEEKSQAREISSGDLDGDGEEEILIANSDRRIYALDNSGEELWKASVQWGVFTAITAGEYEGEFAFYGGTSNPSMHGRTILFNANGEILRYFQRPDIVSWSIPSRHHDMRIVDLDGDGKKEIINAIETNVRQLIVYKEDGSMLWDADVAGAAKALAVKPSAKQGDVPVVYCSSELGYISAYNGLTGVRLWNCYIGDTAGYVEIIDGENIMAVTSSGKIYVIDPNGKYVGCQDIGCPVTALLRPGDHRTTSTIVIGTGDGRVMAIGSKK